ncbi:MAG: hypothetical protein KAT86_00340 [Candidatus Latescibacteria bacterium]|nr:hypothetical protein [Candidatus Latescibacterota bacterium]
MQITYGAAQIILADGVFMYEAACLEEAEWVNKRDYWGYIHRALAT